MMVLGGTGTNAVNVGIGTPTPQNTLDVVGGARIENLSIGGVVFANTSGDLYIGTIPSTLSASTTSAFSVYSSISQAVASNSTSIINFNTVVNNLGNNFNTSTYQYSAPVAGTYSFSGQLTTASIGQVDLALFVNGVEKRRATNFGAPGNAVNMTTSISTTIQLNPSDLVDLRVIQYSGSNQSTVILSNDSILFSGSRLF